VNWFRKKPEPHLTPELEAQIRASFDKSSNDEQHFPATIDPRIFHVKLILDWFGDLSAKSVLDVGCGKGRFTRILKERYPSAEVHGLDISPEMLKCVPADIHTHAGLMTALPYPEHRFDCVYATESLEHAVEIGLAVQEMCRVLKPGGRLVIIDKNVEHFGKLQTPEWERWFGRKELEQLLRRDCRQVESRFISYWEDVPPDGMFLGWLAQK
jgi:ubiquinone/menaquinone biosynthesis C-methylase UbiE